VVVILGCFKPGKVIQEVYLVRCTE